MIEHYCAPNPNIPKVVIVIVDYDKIQKVKEAIDCRFTRAMCVVNGIGTCRSEILDMLGVGETEKAFLGFLTPAFKAAEILKTLTEKLEFNSPAKGIAFTLPLSGMSLPVFKMFDEERLLKLAEKLEPEKKEAIASLFKQARENPKAQQVKMEIERMKAKMENELEKHDEGGFRHDLILAVINQGYSDELMEAARAAGASGGTVIQARRSGSGDTVKFFGISLQEEKEIVAILTKRETRKEIMKSVNHSCGLSTEAAGIVFSLPVDSVAGLTSVD